MNGDFNAITALVLLFFVVTPISADEVDDYIEQHLRQLHIPGLSLAVVRGGKIIKARGYGLANIEQNVPTTQRTVYEIGSVSKQFTAAAVMMLAEEGRIGLDDEISKYFPTAPKGWGGITIKHLLSHTSGIQNHVALPEFISTVFRVNLAFEYAINRDDLLKLFFQLPLEYKPGETWAYDNTGYYLLGLVIEQASGKPYWQFLEERIFRPLGMDSTRNTDPRPIVRNRASGYEWRTDSFENRPVLAPFVAFSAGAILSTIEDLARWDAVLYSEKPLKQSSLKQMWTPALTKEGVRTSFDYGFGWFIDSFHGQRFVQHSGGTPGFSSVFYRFLDQKLTIIILSNHSDRIIDHLAIEIAGHYAPALKRTLSPTDPDQPTTSMLKELFLNLTQGKHNPALFTPAMRIFLVTATGKAFWAWIAGHGNLNSFTFSDQEEIGDYKILRYQVALGDNRLWFSFKFDKKGRLAQITWW